MLCQLVTLLPYYKKLSVRALIIEDFNNAFKKYDFYSQSDPRHIPALKLVLEQ